MEQLMKAEMHYVMMDCGAMELQSAREQADVWEELLLTAMTAIHALMIHAMN
jgi:hypothetical protein